MAIVSAEGRKAVRDMWPQWFTTIEEPVEDVDDDEGDGAEWKFTDESVTPEEAERVLESALANPTGTLSAADLEGGW